jgi:hypothetical protein
MRVTRASTRRPTAASWKYGGRGVPKVAPASAAFVKRLKGAFDDRYDAVSAASRDADERHPVGEEHLMTTRRLLPLSGIVFVLLIALAVVIGGGTPNPDASAAKVMSFYNAHDAREIASALVLATSVPFLAFFAVALATALWPVEADGRPVWELVLVGGSVLAGGAILLAAAVHFALADGADHLSASALQVLNVVDGDGWVAWNAGIGVMMLGAAGCLLSRATGSRWLAWTALPLGVLLFIPFADFFALLASGLWILTTSVVLFRRSGVPAYAAAPGVAS